ncbi:MAG: glutaredoxin 3 [Actinomycetota bacterium]
MAPVIIYTSDRCSYCDRAKGLLASRGVPFDEVRIERGDHEARVALAERTGRTTLPQIFIGATAIGGFDDLHALDRAGRLAEMLSRE